MAQCQYPYSFFFFTFALFTAARCAVLFYWTLNNENFLHILLFLFPLVLYTYIHIVAPFKDFICFPLFSFKPYLYIYIYIHILHYKNKYAPYCLSNNFIWRSDDVSALDYSVTRTLKLDRRE